MYLLNKIIQLVMFIMAVLTSWTGDYAQAAYLMAFAVYLRATAPTPS